MFLGLCWVIVGRGEEKGITTATAPPQKRSHQKSENSALNMQKHHEGDATEKLKNNLLTEI